MNRNKLAAWSRRGLLLAACILIVTPVAGQQKPADSETKPAPEKKQLTGDEIVAKVREHQHFDSMDATLRMVLVDKNNVTQERTFTLQRQDKKVMIRFLDPPNIKNTGYLINQNQKGEDQVFVYFPPPTDDYRQINVNEEGENQSFLGSDFDVTDFQVKDPEATKNEYVRTETIANIECYVVKSTPVDPNYKYKETLSWVRTDEWLPIMAQFFDREGNKVKEMKVFKFKTVEGKKVASKFQMEDLAKSHKTVVEMVDLTFATDFPDDHFTIRRLTNP